MDALKKTLIVAVLVALTACYSETTPVESPKIPRDKMLQILTDVYLAEADIFKKGQNDTQKDSLATYYYAQIFALHEVTPQDFDQSMKAWMQQPRELRKLYGDVEQNLKKQTPQQ